MEDAKIIEMNNEVTDEIVEACATDTVVKVVTGVAVTGLVVYLGYKAFKYFAAKKAAKKALLEGETAGVECSEIIDDDSEEEI